VAHVEEAGRAAHGVVLVEQAAVLDRQLPAGEVDQLAALGAVPGVE
jgi:hypothetical protein